MALTQGMLNMAARRAGIVLAFVGSGAVTYSLLTAERESVPPTPTALAGAASCEKLVTTVLAKPDGTTKTVREVLRVDCETGSPAPPEDTVGGAASRLAGRALLHLLIL